MSTFKYEVCLDTLSCLTSQEREDEIRVIVTEDGRKPGAPIDYWYISGGEERKINREFKFNNSLCVKVVELDASGKFYGFLDSDDDIGKVNIDETNIDDQFVVFKDPGGFEYQLTWKSMSEFVGDTPEKLLSKYEKYESKARKFDLNQDGEGKSISEKSKTAYWKIKEHLDQDERVPRTLAVLKEAESTFRKTDDVVERNKAIDKVEQVIEFLGLHGIAENTRMGEFGSIIIIGFGTPVNVGTAERGIAAGFAISTQPNSKGKKDRARLLASTSFALGLTEGDIQRIAIGWNRNPPKDVPDWTYDISIPSDAELPNGAITFSYDAVPLYEIPAMVLKLEFFKLQEVTYSYGLLPGGVSAGVTFTAGFKSRFA